MGSKLSDHVSRFLELVIEDTFNKSDLPPIKNEFQHRLAIATDALQDSRSAPPPLAVSVDQVAVELSQACAGDPIANDKIDDILNSPILTDKLNLLKVINYLSQIDPPILNAPPKRSLAPRDPLSPDVIPQPSTRRKYAKQEQASHGREERPKLHLDSNISKADLIAAPSYERKRLEMTQLSFYSNEPPPLDSVGEIQSGHDGGLRSLESLEEISKLRESTTKELLESPADYQSVSPSDRNNAKHVDVRDLRREMLLDDTSVAGDSPILAPAKPANAQLPQQLNLITPSLDLPVSTWQKLSEELPRPSKAAYNDIAESSDNSVDSSMDIRIISHITSDPMARSGNLLSTSTYVAEPPKSSNDSSDSSRQSQLTSTLTESIVKPLSMRQALRMNSGAFDMGGGIDEHPDQCASGWPAKDPQEFNLSNNDSSNSDLLVNRRNQSSLEINNNQTVHLDVRTEIVKERNEGAPYGKHNKFDSYDSSSRISQRKVSLTREHNRDSQGPRAGETKSSGTVNRRLCPAPTLEETNAGNDPNNKFTLNINVINDSTSFAVATLSSNQSTAPDERRTGAASSQADDELGQRLNRKALNLNERLKRIGSKSELSKNVDALQEIAQHDSEADATRKYQPPPRDKKHVSSESRNVKSIPQGDGFDAMELVDEDVEAPGYSSRPNRNRRRPVPLDSVRSSGIGVDQDRHNMISEESVNRQNLGRISNAGFPNSTLRSHESLHSNAVRQSINAQSGAQSDRVLRDRLSPGSRRRLFEDVDVPPMRYPSHDQDQDHRYTSGPEPRPQRYRPEDSLIDIPYYSSTTAPERTGNQTKPGHGRPKSISSNGDSIKRFSNEYPVPGGKARYEQIEPGQRYFSGDAVSIISDSSYPQGDRPGRVLRSSLGRVSVEDAEQALMLRSPEGVSGSLAVLRDVLYALQGVEGQHLVYDRPTHTFLVADANLPMNRTTRLITCQMALPGTHFRLLKAQLGALDSAKSRLLENQTLVKTTSGRIQILDESDESQLHDYSSRYTTSDLFTKIFSIGKAGSLSAVRQLFVENVESELARYLVSLGYLETELVRFERDLQLHEVTSNLPAAKIAFSNTLLRRLITSLKPGFRLVHTLHLLVAAVGSSVGGDLLNRLWRFQFTGDPNCDQVARKIFNAASTPFYKFIRSWVAHGSTNDDVYREFFVRSGKKELIKRHANDLGESVSYYEWYKAFEIDTALLPSFLASPLIEKIIDVGLMAALINKAKSDQANYTAALMDSGTPTDPSKWDIDQLFQDGASNWQQNAQQPSGQDELRIDSYDRDAQIHDQKRVKTDWQLCNYVRVHRYEHLQELRHILLVEHGMLDHLKILFNCVLFGAGDFAHNLMEITTQLLLSRGSPADISAGELQSCLAQSIRSSIVPAHCNDLKLERLQCVKMPTGIQFGTSIWDFFSLDYDLSDSPVSVVLSPPIIADLRRVSAFLWKVKRSCDRQHASWFSGQRNAFLLRFPEVNDTVLDALHTRAEILASLEKIQFHVFYDVLDGLWADLVLKVMSEGWWESIDELRSIFEMFIESFKQKGFMTCNEDCAQVVLTPDNAASYSDPSSVVNDLLDLSNVACTQLDSLFMSAYQLVSHKLQTNEEESMSLEEIDQQIEKDRSRFREENAPKMSEWRQDWEQCQKQWIKIVNAQQSPASQALLLLQG